MFRLLVRYFIKNPEATEDLRVRRLYGMICSVYGIFLNLLLFVLKVGIGMMAGSIAATADAFNNLFDAGGSIITMLGFKLSARPDDAVHPFGYGRIEYVSGLIVATLIVAMSGELIVQSIQRMFDPKTVELTGTVGIILIFTILVKLYMALYNYSTSKKIRSPALRAIALDSISDVMATTAVLTSMLINDCWGLRVDAWVGLVVSLIILRTGLQAGNATISPLLGTPPSPKFVSRVSGIVLSDARVLSLHNLIVHNYGAGRVMISLHAEVSARSDLLEIHEVIDGIERRLAEEERCMAVIHIDPVMDDDQSVRRIRREMEELLWARVCPELVIHDFRMTPNTPNAKVIFDVTLPAGYWGTDVEMARKIQEIVREEGGHRAVVSVRHSYSGMI